MRVSSTASAYFAGSSLKPGAMIASAQGMANSAADAFVVAFKLPNLFRRLFAEGAFSAAFVPMFARKLAGEGKEAARLFAEMGICASHISLTDEGGFVVAYVILETP